MTATDKKNSDSTQKTAKTAGAVKKKISPKVRRQRQAWFRIIVQIVFFAYAPSIYNSAFTAAKNTFTSFGTGQPLQLDAFAIQFILVVAYTVLFGRFFCGWACAFGALNDWVYRFVQWILKKIHVKSPKIPDKAVSLLQWMKYVVLICMLALCFAGRSSLISKNSPWTVFSLIRSGNFAAVGKFTVGIVLLVVLIVGMAIQERFFCQFFCPMGAIFSMLPIMPFFRLKRDSANCPERCGACQKVCPVNLLMEESSPKLGECIRCGRCSGICPKGNISSCGAFKGDEFWMDGLKAVLLIALIFAIQHIG